ncbi:MAG: N-acetyltransferase [Segetibacter sp.]|nr:N-acetyltransferase [Segetibacter sp.]
MNIQHEQRDYTGMFFIEQDGKKVAKMSYKKTPGTLTIEHTEVDESLQGQSVGQHLVKEAVSYVRQNNLKLSATCTFAHAILQKDESFKDVWQA